jgi:RNA polymerase sigma factor (sigma-70 family)
VSAAREDQAALDPATLELARAARGGSPQQFGKLYERVAPAVFAWAALRLRGRLRAQLEPEDLCQEIWMRALDLFPNSDATHDNFRAWIFSVAKYVLQEALRRHERSSAQQGGPEASAKIRLLEGVADEVTSTTHRIARNEALSNFIARADRLEEDDRALFVHCGLEGLSCAQAGERIGASADAATKRWQRLRARLEREGLPQGLIELAQ